MPEVKIETINWKTLSELPGKEGNPWGTTPTKAMIFGLEPPRFKTYKMQGEVKDYLVEYDRAYVVQWCKQKLGFIIGLSGEERDLFLGDLFNE